MLEEGRKHKTCGQHLEQLVQAYYTAASHHPQALQRLRCLIADCDLSESKYDLQLVQETMPGFAERIKNLDGHSTVSKEFRVYTVQGAALSVVTILGTYRKSTK